MRAVLVPVIFAFLFAPGVRPAAAQHPLAEAGLYDPNVPTPRSVLGYELGERFTPHHLLMRYAERLAAASPRIRFDTVAHTFEGREVLMAVVTGEANQARLAEIRRDAQRLADPRGAGTAELEAIVARMPTIVWLGHTVHGNEASGMEAAIALMYQLAAGQDEATRTILDSAVVLIDPVENPDGHERHAQDTWRRRGALGIPTHPAARIHGGTWPGARTSHYHFDLNRDWFIHSHPETRGRIAAMLEWWPHVAADLHEMGSNSTYFFPPSMDPINVLVHGTVRKWWEIIAAGNAAAFDRHGWSFFRREGYDEFYTGYGGSWPIYAGAVGMTYEQASSRGGAILRSDGTVLTLLEAAKHHYATGFATALTMARRRAERVRDYLEFRRSAVADGERGPIRAIVFEPDAQGRADSLAARLVANGIEVRRLASAADVRDATAYGAERAAPARFAAGAYVVDLAQPQGRLAKALLEPDAPLDSTFIAEELDRRRTGRPGRFYDVTGWSLPFAFRVRAWWTRLVPGPTEPLPAGDVATVASPALPSEAGYGYAFEAGSDASIRLLAGLLADSVRVWYAPYGFRSGGADFPQGALVVRVAANDADVHETVRRLASESGARVAALGSAMVDAGTDLGSNSVFPVRPPRVALVGGDPISGNSFGYAWYALDQRLRYPTTTIDADAISTATLESFDALILPSTSAGALDGVLGEGGREAVQDWVRRGGLLITLDGATAWLASERTGLSRLRLRRDTTRADGEPGAPLPASVPGAIVRAVGDTLSPLLAGVHEATFPALVFSGRIYETPEDLRPGELAARFEELPRLRLAGYLWPEVPERLAGTPYLWTERAGRGRVIGFTGEPNFRDQWPGLRALFANAVLLGGSF